MNISQQKRSRRTFFAKLKLFLTFFGVSTAPAFASHLLARKQRASPCRVGGFTLVKRTVGADLTGCVFRVFFGVCFGCVCFVPQRNRRRVFVFEHRLRLRQAGRGNDAGSKDGLNNKGSAVGGHSRYKLKQRQNRRAVM